MFLENRRRALPLICVLLLALSLSLSKSVLADNAAEFMPEKDTSVSLTQIGLYTENQNSPPPEQVQDINRWLSAMKPVDKVSITGGAFWYRFDLSHQADNPKWVLDVSNGLIEYIDYYLYSDKLINHQQSGYYEVAEFPFYYGHTFTLEPGVQYQLLVRVESRYFASQPKPEVLSFDSYRHRNLFENIFMVASLGTLLALGLYNLFVFAGSRDKSHLYYAIYLFTYFAGWSLVFQVPNTLFDWHLLELNYIPFFLMPLIGGYFCIVFLRLHEFLPRLAWVLKINGFISLALLPASIFLIGYAHSLATLTIGIWVITAFIAGIKRWQQRFRPASYFVIAFMCLLIPAVFILPSNLGLIPDLLDNAELVTLVGGTIEAIFLAFALADRMSLINQRNVELTTQLEATVDKRTKQLSEANHSLEKLIEKLTEANLSKSRFLANMSHEIRTPLTSIIGYADGILLGDIDKSEQTRVTKIISENGNHLLNVISDILDISKIEAGKLDFEFIPTSLFSILAQVESIAGKRARDKGLAFHLDYQYPLPMHIITDPTRLKQILFNLINNALKFTETGHIGLTVAVQGHQLSIQVNDSGLGISAAQQQELFSPFTQANNTINRRFGGTGLGLSISQKLAQGLGGDITVQSAPQQGSQFTLKIKLVLSKNDKWINSIEDIWNTAINRSEKDIQLPDFNGSKILLADDHPNNRELIALLLKRMNITVVEVSNGKQALEAVSEQDFDLILMDIQMPEMDGIQAFKKIREMGNFTPVIALTANNMKHEIAQYVQIGFSNHLAKPVVRHHFVEKLTRYLHPNGQVVSPLTDNDMLLLIDEYLDSLKLQLSEAQEAWEKHDFEMLAEASHKIKGSAGSFGFIRLGDMFGELEAFALENNEAAIQQRFSNIMAYAVFCSQLPGVNVAQAIVAHDNDISRFHSNLGSLIQASQLLLNLISEALNQNNNDEALMHLNKLASNMHNAGLETSHKFCEQLGQALELGDAGKSSCLEHINSIHQYLEQLSSILAEASY